MYWDEGIRTFFLLNFVSYLKNPQVTVANRPHRHPSKELNFKEPLIQNNNIVWKDGRFCGTEH
jgi:hypothetical protein